MHIPDPDSIVKAANSQYVARGFVYGVVCIGTGGTHSEAFNDYYTNAERQVDNLPWAFKPQAG